MCHFSSPEFVGVGEFGTDGDILHWLLLIMFFCLPFAIWLSLQLAGLDILDWISFPGDSWCYVSWAREGLQRGEQSCVSG